MKERLTTTRQQHYSPRAVLAAIGMQMRAMGILNPIQEQVHIKQKRLKYSPVEKLIDLLITILGGAQGISEINTRLRSDQALQRAFGRNGCAEQSVVQETLDACTPTNVAQLMQAINLIFQQRSLASRHDFSTRMLLLDTICRGCLVASSRKRPPKAIKVSAAFGGADSWAESSRHSMKRSSSIASIPAISI